MTTIIEILQGQGIVPKKTAGTNGGEWASSCPSCGGEDRFRVWPARGKFWCRSCDTKGDAVDLLRLIRPGLSYVEACQELGKDPGPLPATRGELRPTWTPCPATDPAGDWQKRAGGFVGWAHRNLLGNPDRLAWLSSCRGLSLESVKRFRLGWNPSELYRKREEWGLPLELRDDGRPKKLWSPAGLVIPTFRAGAVVRVQVRRPEGEPRYICLPGSSTEPATVGDGTAGAVIVESELDAFLIGQEAGDLVVAVAIRSAAGKPDKATHETLNDGRAVLVALDGDEAGGKAAWGFWRENYPAAIRWPSGAKDPTDGWRAGLSIRGWVVEGLRVAISGNGDRTPEDFEERAAILEFDGGISRDEAERRAARR